MSRISGLRNDMNKRTFYKEQKINNRSFEFLDFIKYNSSTNFHLDINDALWYILPECFAKNVISISSIKYDFVVVGNKWEQFQDLLISETSSIINFFNCWWDDKRIFCISFNNKESDNIFLMTIIDDGFMLKISNKQHMMASWCKADS